MKLYSYFRSSAAYRLRIALNLKGLPYDYQAVNLLQQEQKAADYLSMNPQGLVPALELDGGEVLAQSVAILEWLEEVHPQPPLLPRDPLQRARVRSMVNNVCCDIHPLCNSSVIAYLRERCAADEDAVRQWFRTWMHRGFAAIETLLARNATPFAFGDTPGMADVVLVPQVFNARRFAIPLDNFPCLTRVVDHCNTLGAFADAAPERQPDALP